VSPVPVEKLGHGEDALGVENGPLTGPLGTSQESIGGAVAPHTYPPTYPNNQKQWFASVGTVPTREAAAVDDGEGWPPVAKQFSPPTGLPAPAPPAPGRCRSHPWVPLVTDHAWCSHCAREQAAERAGERYLRLAAG
jgi:hypothetical protein